MQLVLEATTQNTPAARVAAVPFVRREDGALLRGLGRFVHDVQLPGALHLACVRGSHAHATLGHIDLEPAKAVPGVLAILTAADLGAHYMPAPNGLLELADEPGFPLLAVDTLAYVGQPVALVLASSHEAAHRAASLVHLDVVAQAAAPDFGPQTPTTRVAHQRDADPAPITHRVSAKLSSPRLAAMAMEPRACCARWDPLTGSLTAWLGTQTPSRAKADLAGVLGIAIDRVRVISPDVGGAFGAKASVGPEDLLVGLAARHLRATVRWVSSRSEDFVAGMHGRGARLSGELALDAAGSFVALVARLEFTLGAWLAYSAVVPLRNAARILPGPYRVRGLDIQGQASRSHTAPVTIYRGAGRPEAALLMETLVDKAARASGIDPVELRRRNLIPASAMPYTTPTGELLDSGDYPQALDSACRRFGYEAERSLQQQRRAAGELVGIGVAMYIEPCGQGWESARVTLHVGGSVTVASGTPAQGQGHATTFAQIAAGELGCAREDVLVLMGDTESCPVGTGALASRSTAIGGSAIAQACREALLRRHAGEPLPITVDARFTAAEAWSYGCVIARMCIDRDTGKPSVERIVWTDDAGHIVNPVLARGQLLGGAAQGLGQALMERLVYDDAGQLLSGSLMDYAVPRACDMPVIDIQSMHIPSPNNLLGAKGVGEAGCIGVPAALMNAARDALRGFGEPELQLPLRAEQLWRAMQKPPSAPPH